MPQLALMRNGHKLKQLLYVCDINLTLRDDERLYLSVVHKGTRESFQVDGPTFSAVLDKAWRRVLGRKGLQSDAK